jgi:hypothetical protein
MKLIRTMLVVMLKPLALCIGIYGCTYAHVAMLTH